jgi:hypothetical protein
MAYSEAEIRELAKRIGKSRTTLWRWASQGCDLRNHQSVQTWIEKNRQRETNVEKSRRRRRRGAQQEASSSVHEQYRGAFDHPGNGELPPAGKHGAQHALQRLEFEESQAYQRLQHALQNGTPLEVESAQSFWLKCSEALRRLDLAVELALRDAEEQVPKRLACDVAVAISGLASDQLYDFSFERMPSIDGYQGYQSMESPCNYGIQIDSAFDGSQLLENQ